MKSFKLEKGPRDLSDIVGYLSALSRTVAFEVIVKRFQKKRSLDQNAALWGLAYKILREETGNDAIDLHDFFCKRYFGEVEVCVMGTTSKRARRSTTHDEHGEREVITTKDFMDFYSFIQQFSAMELGINIPEPDPHWREHDEEQQEAA